MRAETIEPATADIAAAPLDLLLTDAALGVLNRMVPDGRMAVARGDLPGVLVAGLRGLAGLTLRRGGGRPDRAGRRRAGADLRRAGNLRL